MSSFDEAMWEVSDALLSRDMQPLESLDSMGKSRLSAQRTFSHGWGDPECCIEFGAISNEELGDLIEVRVKLADPHEKATQDRTYLEETKRFLLNDMIMLYDDPGGREVRQTGEFVEGMAKAGGFVRYTLIERAQRTPEQYGTSIGDYMLKAYDKLMAWNLAAREDAAPKKTIFG